MSDGKYVIGAIAGDIIGSVYEWNNVKTINFDLFCRKSTFTKVLKILPKEFVDIIKQFSLLYRK